MDDDSEFYRAWKKRSLEARKARGLKNMAAANEEGWEKHTQFHWSQDLNGHRLDYWPSRNKFQYLGLVMTGNVTEFINKRRRPPHD